MYKLNKEDMEYIALHCNNVYSGKHKHTARCMPFKRGHINGYVLKDHGAVYIFIAGTDDIKDIGTDIRLAPSRFNGGSSKIKVHVGFEDAYRSIESVLMQYCKNESNVIIAGHSMGGAIATLAAYKLSKTVQDVTCVTFGSPRVGNRAFTKSFNKLVPSSYRLVYRNDIVTQIPKLFRYYRHVNTLCQSKKKRWFAFVVQKVLDHPMQNYIDGIKNNMWKFKG